MQGRDTLITRASWTRRDSISGRTVRGGREYFRVEMSRSGGWNVTLLRQDGSGLYEWDGSPSDQRDLAYPLHVGARWQWSFGTNRVEAREVVATPAGRLPAWRVWVDPGDSSSTFRQWVGTCGLIGIVATYHHEWVDPDGPRVIVDAEEREWLSSVQLVDDRREPAAARTSSEPTAARSRSEGAQARE